MKTNTIMDTRQSACLFCPLGCDLAFRVKGESVIGPEFCEVDNVPHSARLCARGLYGTELLNHPQRVSTPLMRRDGVLREASWDAAIDAVVSALQSVIQTSGSETIAIVTEPTRSTEEIEAVGHLAHTIGAGAVSCMFEPQDWPLVAEGRSADDSTIQEANCVIVFGDVFFTHPVLAKKIIDAKYTARGNNLFVVDPRRSNTAWYASEHVQNLPGTEALVLACLLKALRSSGKVTGEALAWLDSVDEESLLDTAGVTGDSVSRMAYAFTGADKAAVIVAPPVRGMVDVGLVSHLATLLAELAGDRKACVLLPSGGNVRGAQEVVVNGNWKPVSVLTTELAQGKYRALLSFGADLLDTFPSPELARAVSELDLVASFSLFRGQTEQICSTVLAGASWLESDGSAALFDGSPLRVKSVGAPSWGSRTLPDVVALLEASLTSAGMPSRDEPRDEVGCAEFVAPREGLAARLSSVAKEADSRGSDSITLITLPATGHSGAGSVTGWISWATEVFPAGFVEINAEDAVARGMSEGESVILVAGEAQLESRTRITDRLPSGVMAVPGYDPAARTLFSWETGSDGWFPTGPGRIRIYRKQ